MRRAGGDGNFGRFGDTRIECHLEQRLVAESLLSDLGGRNLILGLEQGLFAKALLSLVSGPFPTENVPSGAESNGSENAIDLEI